MKAVIALACIVVYLTSSIDSRKPGCRVPERYCRWIRNDGYPQFGCLVPPNWVCHENAIATYPPVPAQTLLPSVHCQERSRVEPEVKPLVPTSYYSELLDLTGPAQSSSSSSTSNVRFHSHRIINYYKPKLQETMCTSVYAAIYSKKFNKDVFSLESTSKGSSSTSDSPGSPIQTTITDVTYSSSPQPPITSIIPVPFNAASHLHEIIPFTTPTYAEEDGMTRPSVPGPDDFIKPILEVTCVDRARFFWSDFKITWSTAWNDQRGCQNLFRAMERRGLVTGWSCKQAADNNGYVMQAEGHRPRSPRRLVADAIREAFELENTLYYRGYETRLLCEKNV